MNECVHHHKASCVRGPRTHSPGICARCEVYADSGTARVPLTIKSTSKPQPIPRAEWPLAARIIAKLRTDADAGIGSTIHRLAGATGEMYEWAFKAITKKPCGCRDRAAYLDERYPYNQA